MQNFDLRKKSYEKFLVENKNETPTKNLFLLIFKSEFFEFLKP